MSIKFVGSVKNGATCMTLPFLTVETVDAGNHLNRARDEDAKFLVSTLPEEDVVSSVESPETRAIE
jgi:hypothetical protein